MAGAVLQNISEILRLGIQNNSLIHGLENVCCVNRHEKENNLIVHLQQSCCMNRCIVNEWLSFEWTLFSPSKD